MFIYNKYCGLPKAAPTNKTTKLTDYSVSLFLLFYILEQRYDILFAAHSYCLIYYLSVL